MTPGDPAICRGHVFHLREFPRRHEFRNRVSYVWLDPDVPDDLCGKHPLWSSRRRAPARFRRCDYGDGSGASLASGVRDELASVLGNRPDGEVRMLTQVRRWGWMFNPITLYVVWDDDPHAPVGVVLEVTNTPWKERMRYPVGLIRTEGEDRPGLFAARVGKVLHVSPFLDEQHDYVIALHDDDRTIDLSIDVVPHDAEEPIVKTRLCLDRQPATRAALQRALFTELAPTHRVSLGIRTQALLLWFRRIPVVAHPAKRGSNP
jgi:DUF1365 family protein